MRGLNKVILMGNVGREPEIRRLDTGVAVATFSLATTETYNNKAGERVSQTEWHNIVMWRGLAEIAEKYIHKGDPLYVEGSLRSRSYPDKDNPAVTRYITEIVVQDMRLISSKGGGSGEYSQPSAPASQAPYQAQAAPQSGSYQGGGAQPQAQAAPSTQYSNYSADMPEDEGDDLPF